MRQPWCASYFSLSPRSTEMVSSTEGSVTSTDWKRRARAASFSMCLRYSSSVVAPMQCSSPRARAGLSMLLASIAPSPAPAPTRVCSSSMKRMTFPLASTVSLSTPLSRSSNSPRYLAPAMSVPRSSEYTVLSLTLSGTSPLTMRCAMPSTMAVLPTPGSPMRTGLFLVRREMTCTVRRMISSRPMTGSRRPSRASCVRSRAYFFRNSPGGCAFGFTH
mmetsp:Transcript_5753/g.18084  ORF Transcript_5753/g.18084 Transcript_5753/m.18084 type:complete len:218 (+) Transcript_5753:1760-2413(+)